jgi:DNA-binding NarL/FixJ family response regulator
MPVDLALKDRTRSDAQGQVPLDDPIRLLIADDDESTRELLRDTLAAQGFDIVGAARDGTQACDEAARLKPEVVLMDLRMPGIDGMEATVVIKANVPRTQVVILTAFSEEDSKWVSELMGAAGLVDKDSSLDVLVETLRAAALVYRASSRDVAAAELCADEESLAGHLSAICRAARTGMTISVQRGSEAISGSPERLIAIPLQN